MSIEAHHNTKPAPGHQQNRENTYQVYNGIFQTTGYRIEINCRRNKSVSWWGYDSASVCHAIPSLILCGTYLVGYQATHARHKTKLRAATYEYELSCMYPHRSDQRRLTRGPRNGTLAGNRARPTESSLGMSDILCVVYSYKKHRNR